MPAGSPRRVIPSPSTRTGGAAPSARQTEILQLIAQGRSNKEIARQLGLTEGTVKQHLYALYRKLGVRNRTQALREGARWLPTGPAAVEAVAPAYYARRLVTAVVLLPQAGSPGDLRGAEMAAAIDLMRRRVAALAQAFDGVPEALSGGGLALWFGHPVAHGDDVARALAFTRAVREARFDEQPLASGMGLASAAEVMGEGGSGGSLALRTLRTATLLASLAAPSSPVVCGLTARLAGLERGHEAAALPEDGLVLPPERPASAAVARDWGGLPFCAELVMAAQRRRAQWLAVESWPPEDGTRLLTAIGEYLGARGLLVRVLWAPARGRQGDAAAAFLRQLQPAGTAPASSGAALAEALAALPERKLTLVLVHGIDALASMKESLGAEGLARLRGVPLIVAAGAMQRGSEAQTTVRLLGSNPADTPIVRVLRLTVPSAEGRPDVGVRPDVQAVFDSVSAEARRIARAAAADGAASLPMLSDQLGLAPEDLLRHCRELERAGLVRVEEGGLRFRDELTAAAVRASMS